MNEYHTHEVLVEIENATQKVSVHHSHNFEPGGHMHGLVCGPATVEETRIV